MKLYYKGNKIVEGYFFDKRKIKKYAKKYSLIALGLFPILLFINLGLSRIVDNRVVSVLLLALFAGALLALVEFALVKIKEAKAKKEAADVVVVKAGALGKKHKKYVKTTTAVQVADSEDDVKTKNVKETKSKNIKK